MELTDVVRASGCWNGSPSACIPRPKPRAHLDNTTIQTQTRACSCAKKGTTTIQKPEAARKCATCKRTCVLSNNTPRVTKPRPSGTCDKRSHVPWPTHCWAIDSEAKMQRIIARWDSTSIPSPKRACRSADTGMSMTKSEKNACRKMEGPSIAPDAACVPCLSPKDSPSVPADPCLQALHKQQDVHLSCKAARRGSSTPEATVERCPVGYISKTEPRRSEREHCDAQISWQNWKGGGRVSPSCMLRTPCLNQAIQGPSGAPNYKNQERRTGSRPCSCMLVGHKQ